MMRYWIISLALAAGCAETTTTENLGQMSIDTGRVEDTHDTPDENPTDLGTPDTPDVTADVGEPDTDEPDVPDEPDTPQGPVPNEGWIGGPCESAADCDYDDALCLADEQGFPEGTCSLPCDRFCPDRDGMNSVTFCVDTTQGAGLCVSRCDYDLYPDSGCREDYDCRILPRHNDSATTQGVCVPADSNQGPDPDTDCLQGLEDAGVVWDHWDYETRYADGLACTIPDPIRVQSPIQGVRYRYTSHDNPAPMSMGCPLALALVRLGRVLREYDIVEVIHIGTFNCRKISGTNELSQHSFGLAIDIYGFVDSHGEDYILERDWEHDTDSPQDPKAQLLYEIAQRMYDERIFNIVLTPNFNAGHDNHFHVDLTAGAHYIGYGTDDQYHIGPNHGH